MFRCGYIAIIGRPNVGKSTLLNRLVGQKLSITSRRPQTTRHRIIGIKTTETAQFLYVDTPGLHSGGRQAMNRLLNRVASNTVAEVDVVLFLVSELQWGEEDERILKLLNDVRVPVILAINKVDQVKDKAALLPYLAGLESKREFAEIVPISAQRGTNLEPLEQSIQALLPESPPLFPTEQTTDRSERFLAAELIREQLMRRLGQEVPYALTVEIERFVEEEGLIRIAALIWVERDAQKAIVIGRQGHRLKQIGQDARRELEQMLDSKVFLQLWVKVKEKWSDDERALRGFGYGE